MLERNLEAEIAGLEERLSSLRIANEVLIEQIEADKIIKAERDRMLALLDQIQGLISRR